ncbi:MAG: hypothetical protein MUF31_08440 [Akkermansiaceae bacterium]|jgi:hypothetical protein|nr:hypothetical protein [Akkermansiaceae bacterium]
MKRFSPLLAFGLLLAASGMTPAPSCPPVDSCPILVAREHRLMSSEWQNLVFRQLLLGTISHRDQIRSMQRRFNRPVAC